MADKKITALTAATSLSQDDLFHVVDSPPSSPSNKKITANNVFNLIPTTIGYGTDAVSSVTVSTSTQALDGKALFLCTLTSSAACVATMSDGDHVGQTITIVAAAKTGGPAATSFKINIDTSSTFTNKDSHPILSIPAVGDSATVIWSGTSWFLQSLQGTAATAAS